MAISCLPTLESSTLSLSSIVVLCHPPHRIGSNMYFQNLMVRCCYCSRVYRLLCFISLILYASICLGKCVRVYVSECGTENNDFTNLLMCVQCSQISSTWGIKHFINDRHRNCFLLLRLYNEYEFRAKWCGSERERKRNRVHVCSL